MNKKLVALVLVTVIVFAAAGVGTMAWFTSQATSAANSFQAGTLSIGTGTGNQFASIMVSDMAPGLPVHQGTTTLQNNGSLPLKLYRINASNIVDEGGLDAVLDVKAFINDINVYTGKLSQLVQENGGFFNPIMSIAAGEEIKLELVVTMSESAGNIYQNKQLKCDFTILAAQEEMPLVGEVGGWEPLTAATNNKFSVKASNTVNPGKITLDVDWAQGTGQLPTHEQYDVFLKHQTGDPDSNVEIAVRYRILLSDVITISQVIDGGEVATSDVTFNKDSKIITINRNTFPDSWEVIDIKIAAMRRQAADIIGVELWRHEGETNYVGWALK